MADIRIVAASVEMAPFLAATLRDADRREATVLAGEEGLVGEIETSIRRSAFAFAALESRGIIAIWGVAPVTLLGSRAAPWCLFSHLAMDHRRAIARHSRALLRPIVERFPDLVNLVDSRNEPAIRWLRWLGFDIGPPVPVGPGRVPFHPFRMESP